MRSGTAARPYTYIDMAGDVIAVLGASLGGAVVRWAAIEHRARVASLTVIMSGAGAAPGEDGPQDDLPAFLRLFGMAERRSRGEAVASMVELWRWMWGAGYPFEEDWVRSA
jgi:pimeloyl-ACP methyl ester carboxylesterase